jgi:hypothetical protein
VEVFLRRGDELIEMAEQPHTPPVRLEAIVLAREYPGALGSSSGWARHNRFAGIFVGPTGLVRSECGLVG